MSNSVQMPALGESVTEGTVTRWLKQVGDDVAVDEPLVEISTDKVDTEIPSPFAGVLEKIVVAEDETAEVGAELAVIGDGSGASADPKEAASSDPVAEPGPSAPADSDAESDAQPEPEAAPAAEVTEPAETPSEDVEAPAEKPVAETKPAGGSGTAVTLPAMGESVTEGTVTRWLKQVGDDVAVDEPLVEISTDKVDTEIPSPIAGTLLEISVGEDETVEVGGRLGIIGEKGSTATAAPEPDAAPEPAAAAPEPKAQAPAAPAKQAAPAAPAATAAAPAAAPAPAPKNESAASTAATAPAAQAAPAAPSWQPAAKSEPSGYVTPVIRKLASDRGVDLSSVTGTGVGGRIRREDVVAAGDAAKAAAEAAAAAAAPAATASATGSAAGATKATPDVAATALIGTTAKLPRIRQSIAKNMLHGLQTAAQLTTVIEVDVTRVANLRTRAKSSFEAREGVKLSYLPFFVKAAVEATKLYPVINSSLSEDLKEITYHGSVNLGIAVDTQRGLIVPVIKDADDLNIGGIARKIADLAARTRDNKIGPDDLSGGTFTITNTGSVGALFDTPIFVPPQSAILGTGAIVRRAVVVAGSDGDEVIAIRSMAYLAMSYDHRNIDGADASRFLAAIKKRIEAGDFEGDLGL